MSHVVLGDEEVAVMHLLKGELLCLRPIVTSATDRDGRTTGLPWVEPCRRRRKHRGRCASEGNRTMRTVCGLTELLVPWDGVGDPLPVCPRCAGEPEPVEEAMFA